MHFFSYRNEHGLCRFQYTSALTPRPKSIADLSSSTARNWAGVWYYLLAQRTPAALAKAKPPVFYRNVKSLKLV